MAIKQLYPHFTEEQLREAEQHLLHYVEVVLRIAEEVRQDPEAYAQFKKLTASRRLANFKHASAVNPPETVQRSPTELAITKP